MTLGCIQIGLNDDGVREREMGARHVDESASLVIDGWLRRRVGGGLKAKRRNYKKCENMLSCCVVGEEREKEFSLGRFGNCQISRSLTHNESTSLPGDREEQLSAVEGKRHREAEEEKNHWR